MIVRGTLKASVNIKEKPMAFGKWLVSGKSSVTQLNNLIDCPDFIQIRDAVKD